MARQIWKGYISFGLVNIPVALYPAERREELKFKLIDARDHAPVRYKRVNEATGEEVAWDNIAKAYELDDGQLVVLTDDEFEKAAAEATQRIEIEGFVASGEIEYPYFEKPYHVAPLRQGEKGYVLLREALKKAGKVAIAKIVMRNRQYLAALLPVGDALVLDVLRFHDELRPTSELAIPREQLEAYQVSDKELAMAAQLVEAMATDWEPKRYRDEYREALLTWIQRKAEAGDRALPPSAPQAGDGSAEVIDIMEQLRRSLQKSGKESRPRRTRSTRRKAGNE